MSVWLSPTQRRALAFICCWIPAALFGRAESVTLFPVADATLIELKPTNSLGAAPWLAAGITQNGNTNRALLRFDVASAIPAGSTVIWAGLNVWVTRDPKDGYAETSFSLRRMLRPWNEGVNPPPSDGTSPGLGSPALPGDATWTHAGWNTNAWTIPGGKEGVDYSDTPSTTASIGPESDRPYLFEAGDATTDAQFWLDHPEQNFGWMLKSDLEVGLEARFTARRFGSRELQDPGASPQLTIEYLPPLLLTSLRTGTNQLTISFRSDAGYLYLVEKRNVVQGTNAWLLWSNYGLILTSGVQRATDTLNSTQQFYRARRN